MILRQVHLFYKSDDLAKGLRVILKDDDGTQDLESMMNVAGQGAQQMLNNAARGGMSLIALLDDLHNQMIEIAAEFRTNGCKFDNQEALLATMDMLILCAFGELPSDEYNGFVYVTEDGTYQAPPLAWPGRS